MDRGKKTQVMTVKTVDVSTKKITAGPDAKGQTLRALGTACTLTTLPLPKPTKVNTKKTGAKPGGKKKGGSYTRKQRGGNVLELKFQKPITPREVLEAAKRIAPAKTEGFVTIPPSKSQSFGQAPTSYITSSAEYDFTRIKPPMNGQPPVAVQLVTEDEIESSNGEVNPNQAKCGYIDTRTGTPYCEANVFANGSTKLFRYWDTSTIDAMAAAEAIRAGRRPPPSLSMQTLQKLSQGLAIQEIAEGPNGYIQLGIDIQQIIQSLQEALKHMQEDQKSYQISIPKLRDPAARQRVQLALDNVNKMIPHVVTALSSAQQHEVAGKAAMATVTAIDNMKPRAQMGQPRVGKPIGKIPKGRSSMTAVKAIQKMKPKGQMQTRKMGAPAGMQTRKR
jgi:hypothetical protein